MQTLLVFVFLAAACTTSQTKDEPVKILFQNNDFYWKDPLKYFKPVQSGFFNYGSLTSAPDPAQNPSPHEVIKIFYEKGTYSSIRGYRGAQFYSHPFDPTDSLSLTYYLYFSPGFDFVKGGKLPGLAGGQTAQCSGGRHSPTCFSARLMWRANGEGEIYAYVPRDSQLDGFCDRSDVVCSPVKGVSLGRGTFTFTPGVWTKITEDIHLNTIGKFDGSARIWFNDKLVYTGTNINWRTNATLHISSIFFSTFFGGSTPDWGAADHCFSYFRNFIISTGSHPPNMGN